MVLVLKIPTLSLFSLSFLFLSFSPSAAARSSRREEEAFSSLSLCINRFSHHFSLSLYSLSLSLSVSLPPFSFSQQQQQQLPLSLPQQLARRRRRCRRHPRRRHGHQTPRRLRQLLRLALLPHLVLLLHRRQPLQDLVLRRRREVEDARPELGLAAALERAADLLAHRREDERDLERAVGADDDGLLAEDLLDDGDVGDVLLEGLVAQEGGD